jgi:hypothetical protein
LIVPADGEGDGAVDGASVVGGLMRILDLSLEIQRLQRFTDMTSFVYDVLNAVSLWLLLVLGIPTLIAGSLWLYWEGWKRFVKKGKGVTRIVLRYFLHHVRAVVVELSEVVLWTPEALRIVRPAVLSLGVFVCVVSNEYEWSFITCSLAAFLELSVENFCSTLIFAMVGVELLIFEKLLKTQSLPIFLMVLIPPSLTRSAYQALSTNDTALSLRRGRGRTRVEQALK